MNRPAFRLGALVLLNVGLLMFLIATWRGGEARVHEPERLKVHNIALPDVSALTADATPLLDVDFIRNHAVFYSRRTYFPPNAASQALVAPDYQFAGSMSLPEGRRIAFVKRRSDQNNRTLHVGDELDGWQVMEIQSAKIVLQHAGQSAELKSPDAPSLSGIIHAPQGPTVADVGIRRLGGGSPAAPNASAPLREIRIYRPPPH